MTARPIPFRRRALIVTVAASMLVFILWNVPALDFALYPFRLFVTFVHETGHGLAALVTGGQFLGFRVFESGAGLAVTAGGARALILPAGYLGAAAFGATLFYLAHTYQNSKHIAVGLGVLLAVVTLLYTGLLSATFSFVAFFVGLLSAGLLIWLGRRADRDINLLVLNILAIMTGLHAVLDLVALIGNSGASLGDVRNDAAAFSAEVAPILSGGIWAAVWAGIAIALLGAAIYTSVIRRWRRGGSLRL
ncbi:MAG: M50 family metallopeptidase [Chloroflexota bacterium]|nr:M50 family metallopeptidase [Chloroflexota bacterium]